MIAYETRTQIARRLGVHANTIDAWIKRGMPSVKVGRIRRVMSAEADAWLEMMHRTASLLRSGVMPAARSARTRRQTVPSLPSSS